MSQDLAPFVAAVLRDETVEQLHKELDQLRSHYQSVELTGPKGAPVYIGRSFNDGGYAGPTEWKIDVSQERTKLLVKDIAQLEIRVSGLMRAVLYQSCRDGYLQYSSYNQDTGFAEGIVLCCGPVAGCWLSVDVLMGPEVYDTLTQTDEWGDPFVPSEDVFGQILAQCCPNAEVKIRSVNFRTDNMQDAMTAWKIPPYDDATTKMNDDANSNSNNNNYEDQLMSEAMC